jgi:hypothetical protein
MAFDFTPYAQGGAAARPDSFSGMADPFQQALARMLQDAPADVKLGITSGYRSPEVQQRLWEEALAKYGNEAEARKWVAPPGKSQHNHGNAADLKFMSPAAQEWVHQNAAKYGLAFPLSNEAWHIELAGARDGHDHPASPPQSAGNALGGTNALTGAGLPPGNAMASAGLATRQPPQWLAPPPVTFTPLELPARRRA